MCRSIQVEEWPVTRYDWSKSSLRKERSGAGEHGRVARSGLMLRAFLLAPHSPRPPSLYVLVSVSSCLRLNPPIVVVQTRPTTEWCR